MGILLECKESLDSGAVTSLRSALDNVLRHNGQSMIKRSDSAHSQMARNSPFSPWYLLPFKEFELCKLRGVKKDSIHYYKQMNSWIEKGKDHFRKYF